MLPIPNPPRIRYATLVLHTFAVYFIALRLAPIMVGRWFAWVLPALHQPTSTVPADWYLQHLAAVTMIPALIAGYVTVRQSFTLAPFSCVIPTVVLVYKMLQFHDPQHSALGGHGMSSFMYFFEVQQVMPTMANPLASDPIRIVAQMTVTAPFYAGVAYATGALLAKFRVPQKLCLFQSEPPEQTEDTAARHPVTHHDC